MNTLKFKTNIKCSGCLSTVTPVLNAEKNIENWAVDLESKDRVLIVDTSTLTAEEVKKTVQKAGFVAEEM